MSKGTIGILSTQILNGQAEIDIFVYSRLIFHLIFCRGLQRSECLNHLSLTLISILTSDALQLELLPHSLHYKGTIVESHHDDTTILLFLLCRHANLCRCREIISRCLLQQEVRNIPNATIYRFLINRNTEVIRTSCLIAIEAEHSPWGRHTELLIVVCMPLPLQSHRCIIELVALHRVHISYLNTSLRLLMRENRLSTVAFRRHLTHYWPVILPCDRLQMHHSSVSLLILEMQKPVFSILCMHPCSLMRTVDVCLTLSQDHL